MQFELLKLHNSFCIIENCIIRFVDNKEDAFISSMLEFGEG